MQTLHGLALSYNCVGRSQEAEELLRKTLEMKKRILGEEHPDTFETMHGLAVCYNSLEQFEMADALFHKTLEMRARVLGDGHPDTKMAMVRAVIESGGGA